jgi:hypothetical protein
VGAEICNTPVLLCEGSTMICATELAVEVREDGGVVVAKGSCADALTKTYSTRGAELGTVTPPWGCAVREAGR